MSKPKITAEWMDKDDDKQVQAVQEGPFKKKVITSSDVINSKQYQNNKEKEKPKEQHKEKGKEKEKIQTKEPISNSKTNECHVIIKENDQYSHYQRLRQKNNRRIYFISWD